jgi:cyclopropane fatty-acyl-phospholipid synthase-like methyltransferase
MWLFGPGYIPQDRKAIIQYLEKIRAEYMRSLVYWRYRIEPETKREREIEYQRNGSKLWTVNRNAFKEGDKSGRYQLLDQ